MAFAPVHLIVLLTAYSVREAISNVVGNSPASEKALESLYMQRLIVPLAPNQSDAPDVDYDKTPTNFPKDPLNNIWGTTAKGTAIVRRILNTPMPERRTVWEFTT